jgi:cytoskeletal protein RodZ
LAKPFYPPHETHRKQDSTQHLGIDQQGSSIMSKILNLVISRYFAIALAGALFAATAAQAGPSRSLSLASTEPTPQTEQPATTPQASTTPAPTEAPKQSPQTTAAEPSKPIAIKHLSGREAEIIRELHRHGIYW